MSPQLGGNLQIKSVASNRVQVQTLANQQWELKRLTDNLICENDNFFAYILHGKNGCLVRLIHKQSEQRELIKTFTNTVVDLVFVHSACDVIACLELSGNITVWSLQCKEIENSNASSTKQNPIEIDLILKITRPHAPTYNSLRIVWCNIPFTAKESIDSSKSNHGYSNYFCVILDDRCEVWSLDKAIEIQNHSGKGFISSDDTNAYIPIVNTHKGDILDVAFSPDEAYLATCGVDGAVKCWSVEKNKCVHKLNPHEGYEVSQIKFLDDLTYSTQSETHTDSFWNFILTLSRPKCEIKLWSCSDWGCLQSISFHSPAVPPPLLRITAHLSSRFLALYDIQRPLLYLMEFSRESSHFMTIAEFTLIQPILSLSVSSLQTIEPTQEPGPLSLSNTVDNLPDKYTLIILHSVHTKSLQELSVCYSQSETSQDLSVKFQSPVIHTLEEIEASPTISDSTDRPLSEISELTAGAIDVTRDDSLTVAIDKLDLDGTVDTQTDDEITIPPGPGSGVETMKKLRSMLNLPPPQISASLQAPEPLAIEEVLKVTSIGAYNYFAEDIEKVEKQIEQEISQNQDLELDTSGTNEITPNDSPEIHIPPSASEVETPNSQQNETQQQENETQQQENETQQQENETRQQENEIKQEATGMKQMENDTTRTDYNLKTINQELLEQRKSNHEMRREISHLSQQLKVLLQQESYLLQTQDHQMRTLGQIMSTQQHITHKVEMNLKASEADRMAEKPRQDKLISNINSNLNHILTTNINTLLTNEVNQIVAKIISEKLDTFQKSLPLLLKDMMAEQMNFIETRLGEFLVQLLQRQDVIEKVSSQLSQAMTAPVKESQKKVFLETAVPAFEKCCKQMFQQMNDAIVRASHEYTKDMQQCVQVIRDQTESVVSEKKENPIRIGNEDVLLKCDHIANSMEQLPTLVCNEIQRVLHDELASWSQSLPSTGNHQVSIDQIKTGIDKSLGEGHIAKAFDLALTANNLEAVEYICGQIQPGEVLESDPPILSQALLLSLIQQLSFDLSSNIQLKLRYLIDAIHSIDLTHEQAGQVLRDLLQTLTQTANQLGSAEPNSVHLSKVNWLLKYVKKTVDSLD